MGSGLAGAFHSSWLVAGLALVPAAAAWVSDGALRRAAADPTLPERLIQRQQRLAVLTALIVSLVLVFGGWRQIWIVPVVWLTLQVTTHRTRRWLHDETWTVGAQMAWNLRIIVGVLGFWYLCAATPALVLLGGAPGWVPVALGILLVAWNHYYPAVVLRALGATPLDRPSLVAVLEPVLARARVPRPRVMRAGPQGAVVANAFALSSTRGDAVLFLDGLLDRLAPDEVAAILGHELAHLEDFSTRRLRLYAVGATLALGAAAVPLVARALELDPRIASTLWPLVVLGSLVVRAVRSQRHETASDARAVELGGDAEALVRALVALHTIARIPRRFAADLERHASHPSLARRIRAIRAIAGLPPGAIEARAFRDPEAGRTVIFEAERLVFASFDSEPPSLDAAALVASASHLDAVRYDQLVELRLAPARDGRATLIAVDSGGTTRRATIAAADVAGAQAIMDRADQRLAPVADDVRRGRGWGQLAACCAWIAALLPTPAWPVLFTATLAIGKPGAPVLAATGAGALVAAALRLRQPETAWAYTTALACAGLACLLAAWAERRRHAARGVPLRDPAPRLTLAALVLLAAGPTALLAWLVWRHPLDLHAAARALPAVVAANAGLAAALLARKGRASGLCGLAAAGLAAGVALAGSTPVRDRFYPDPLIAALPALQIAPLTADPLAHATATGIYDRIRLGPDARHAVLLPFAPRPGAPTPLVTDFAGWRRSLDVVHAEFVDADRLFTVRLDGAQRLLSVETIREGRELWSVRLDAGAYREVELEPATGRWRIDRDLGGEDHGAGERLEGRIGESRVTRTPLPPLPPMDGYMYAVTLGTGANGRGIGLAYHLGEAGNFVRQFVLGSYSLEVAVLQTGARRPALLARTRLNLDCVGPSLRRARATCLAHTPDETFVWDVDPDNGRLVPVAAAHGHLVSSHAEAETILAARDGTWLVLWRGAARATSLARVEERRRLRDADYRDGRLAILAGAGTDTTVALYPLPPATAPDRTRSARRR